MLLRVDTIPFWLRPFYLLWAYLTAGLSYGLIMLWRLTIRFKWENAEVLYQRSNYIYCLWHKNLIMSFMLSFKYPATRRDVWMNHPAWFMKPIHLILYWKGVEKLILGSSGNSGQEAKKGVEEYLRNGYSTCMAVDGPAGPRLVMKPGAASMAMETGVPLVCLEFIVRRKWVLGFTWDRKVIPLPFSTVIVRVNGPYRVTQDNFDELVPVLEQKLGMENVPAITADDLINYAKCADVAAFNAIAKEDENYTLAFKDAGTETGVAFITDDHDLYQTLFNRFKALGFKPTPESARDEERYYKSEAHINYTLYAHKTEEGYSFSLSYTVAR